MIAAQLLWEAVFVSHVAQVALLLKKGVCPDARDYNRCVALHVAAKMGCVPIVGMLIQASRMPTHAILNVRNQSGRTPLHYAIQYHCPGVLSFLLALGANANATDINCRFLVHFAVYASWNALHQLHVAGADVENKDIFGRTPLYYAAVHGKWTFVKGLVKLGAGITDGDIDAIQYASDIDRLRHRAILRAEQSRQMRWARLRSMWLYAIGNCPKQMSGP
jgi:ankyrin repeat protein